MISRISLSAARLQNSIILQIFQGWSQTHILPFIGNAQLCVTGSRAPAVQLSYPESDLDVAIVVADKEEEQAVLQRILSANQRKECFRDQQIVVKRTLAGLTWIPVENVTIEFFGASYYVGKLDFTLRTRKDHERIQNHAEQESKKRFPTDGDKEDYINLIRSLKLSGEETQYCKAKEWLRVPK